MAPAKGRALVLRHSYRVYSLSDADWPLRRLQVRCTQLRVGRSSEKFTPALKINKTRVIIQRWKQPEDRHSYSNKLRFICSRSLFCLHWDGLTRCFAEQMFVVAFIPLTFTTHSKALSGALAGRQAWMLQHRLGKDGWSLELADFRTVWEVDLPHTSLWQYAGGW